MFFKIGLILARKCLTHEPNVLSTILGGCFARFLESVLRSGRPKFEIQGQGDNDSIRGQGDNDSIRGQGDNPALLPGSLLLASGVAIYGLVTQVIMSRIDCRYYSTMDNYDRGHL